MSTVKLIPPHGYNNEYPYDRAEIRIKKDSGKRSKIPLPRNPSGRIRSNSTSSILEKSVRSASARSARSGRSGSARSMVSGGSRHSASSGKLSTNSPRFINWAFNNVSQSFIPSDIEINDYDHVNANNARGSNGQSSGNRSMDDNSTINESHSLESYGNYSPSRSYNTTNNNSSTLEKNNLLTMDTIHSQYSLNINVPPKDKSHGTSSRKPPLHQHQHHRHKRSHSADFIDHLQIDSLLSKKTLPTQELTRGYGAMAVTNNSNNNNYNTPMRQSKSADADMVTPLVRHQTEPPQYSENFDLMKKYDLYEGKIYGVGDSSLEHNSWRSLTSKVPKRSIRRRIFLLLTEPQTSILSAIIFTIIVALILSSVIIMIIETMDYFQYTPDNCILCHSADNQVFITDDTIFNDDTDEKPITPTHQVACVCPPEPYPQLLQIEVWIMYFFTVEWILRIISYSPLRTKENEGMSSFRMYLGYLVEPLTILDFLATFPFYLLRYTNLGGMISLRLLRFFRVFQILRLGSHDPTFTTFMIVMVDALQAFGILLICLMFGAAVFGSWMYWLEKGEWMYTDLLEEPGYAYVRFGADGLTKELSPFHSIPDSFWWFFVTATTAGYGDTYPTSTGGKCVAILAMLSSVLVIAFPVSVFSSLWGKHLKNTGALKCIDGPDDDDDDDDDDVGSSIRSSDGDYRRAPVKYVSTRSERSPVAMQSAMTFTSLVHQHDDSSVSIDDSLVLRPTENETDNDSLSVLELTPNDVADLHRYVETIERSQQGIRKILSKIESNN